MIMHIDMDAFFASIEQAVNPRLRAKPLIVGSRGLPAGQAGNKMHTVVCAASYEAKRLGIDSGMSTRDAFAICPQAEFVAADCAKYIYTSREIFKMLYEYSPNPLYASVDEFQLDFSQETIKEIETAAKEIKEKIRARFGITSSVGVAKNFLLAKLASKINKPNGDCTLTDENLREVLKRLPADKICGVGPATKIKLNRLGIFTCLDLYDCSQEFLTFNFGQVGYNLFWGLKRQEKIEFFTQKDKPKSIGHSYTLPKTESDPQIILGWLSLLCEMVASRLRAKDYAVKTIHLSLAGQNGESFSRQKTFQEATSDGREIALRCLRICPKLGLTGTKVRFLGVSTSQFLRPQSSLLEEVNKRGRLLASVDRINAKHGEWSVFPAAVLRSQIPKFLAK